MPYLTCIGGHGAVSTNQGGAGSRGYWIFRRGGVVVIRYGPVIVRRSKRVRIVWVHWREVLKPTGSIERAKELLKQTIAAKTTPGHGYTRLAMGVRIW